MTRPRSQPVTSRYRILGVLLATLVLALAGCVGARGTARGPVEPVRLATKQGSHTPLQPSAAGTSASSQRCASLLDLIQRVSRETQVEPAMLVGILRTESNFRNDVTSRVGAQGLAQVMPSTARAKKCGDLSDPYQNVLCGARVLKGFVEYYRGDLILGLSGYNAGHAMPNRAQRTRELPANTDYVEKVLWARARFLDRGCDF